MHNLVELVIGVFVELVQVCFNLLRHIRRQRRCWKLVERSDDYKRLCSVVPCENDNAPPKIVNWSLDINEFELGDKKNENTYCYHI